jgi:hypothetical protein
MRLMDALIRVEDVSKRSLVIFMVLLVSAASAALGLALLTAANWLFARAFAPGSGQFYLVADSLIAVLTLMLAAVAECSTIPSARAEAEVVAE